MRSTFPREARRHEAPFAVVAAVVGLAGAGGALSQAGLWAPLEAAVGSSVPAAMACILALLLGTGVGATVARSPRMARTKPLLTAAELLVGLAALELALPYAARPLARAPQAVRALVLGPLLLLPTIGTAALVPLVARDAARETGGSRRVSILFSAALAGLAAGWAIAARVFAPGAGLSAALSAGAIATALTAPPALFSSLRWRTSRSSAPRDIRAPSRQGPSALAMVSVALGFLGGSALLLLVHEVHVGVGEAADLAPAALAGVVAGLAAGAAQTRTLLLHYRETAAARAIAASALVLGAWAFALGALPDVATAMRSFLRSPADAATGHVLLALAIGAPPAAWIGASLQLVLPQLAGRAVAEGAGRSAGAGAAGATLGAAFAGTVLLPQLGAQRALFAVTVGLAALAFALAMRGRARRSVLLTALLSVVLPLAAPRWNMARLALGYDATAPASWAREGIGAGVVAETPTGLGANGRRISPARDAADLAKALATLAPRKDAAASPDDMAIGAALLAGPWTRVVVPRIPPS